MFCQELIWMIIVNKIKNLILNRYFSSFFNRILTPFSLFHIKKPYIVFGNIIQMQTLYQDITIYVLLMGLLEYNNMRLVHIN